MISYRTDRRLLFVGQELTVGRGAGCGIRIAHQPVDDHVSRMSATVRVLEDCVLVSNVSATKPLVLRPLVGGQRPLEPGAATTSMPFGEFFLVMTGRFGREYSVHVDVHDLPSARRPSPTGEGTTQTVDGGGIRLTGVQRLLLTALCEPLLTRNGAHATVATYRQIGARVGRSPDYVRAVLRRLREQLAGEGVAALVAFQLEKAYADFRPALAYWAIHSGTISPSDVCALDAQA
ncbi:hypothetical protein [Kineosporia mesophila]|uniref:hypothetical protein n=1 Tax=Kineosporia mesophila TaxID=566012 RepID=UPI001E5CCE82|nr:hypothetical protein [Kineosporia mesophila]MCD5355201.1 hypothetical protein [Kineosporia mesophila]